MTAAFPVPREALAARRPAGTAAPASAAASPAVSLSGVSFQYKGADRPSVDRLSLSVPESVIFGLLGPNGSGKTTTIGMLTGQLSPAAGGVEVFGRPPAAVRRDFGLVTQETALYGPLSVRFNLAVYAWLYGYRGEAGRNRVAAALRLAGLGDRAGAAARTLSGGMARRLLIARAMLHSPRLVILDEPTLGVDPNQRGELWRHIRALRDAGTTIFLTTNVLEEAEALCDLVAIMRDGRLAAGPAAPGKLRERYGGMIITVRAAATPPVRDAAAAGLRHIRGIARAELKADVHGAAGVFWLRVTTNGGYGIDGKVLMLLADSGAEIIAVDKSVPSLQDVFTKLTVSRAAPG